MPAPVSEPPVPGAELVLDAAAIARMLQRLAHEIFERHPNPQHLALIGIPSRGVHIAQRLAALLEKIGGAPVYQGVIDVSMHRDDLHTRRIRPVHLTRLPAKVDEMTLLLADDVLFSGRTIRSALDALSSFGRPARVQLAALIDRGHRELPIHADYVGKVLPTAYAQRVFVRFQAVDGVPDGVWLERLPA